MFKVKMSEFFRAEPIPGMLRTLVSVQRKKRAPPPSSASTMDFLKVSSGSSKTASLLQSVKNFPHKKRKSTGGTAVVDYDPNTLEALEVHDVLREVEELQGNILELETLYTNLPPNFFDAGYTRANLREYLLTKLPDVGEMHRDPAPAVPTVAAIPPPAPPTLDETQGRRHLANFLHSPHPMTCGGDPVTPFELLLDGVDLLRQTWNTQHHMALYRTPLLTTKPVMLCDNYRHFMLIRLIWGVLFTFADNGADPNFVGNYKDQRGMTISRWADKWADVGQRYTDPKKADYVAVPIVSVLIRLFQYQEGDDRFFHICNVLTTNMFNKNNYYKDRLYANGIYDYDYIDALPKIRTEHRRIVAGMPVPYVMFFVKTSEEMHGTALRVLRKHRSVVYVANRMTPFTVRSLEQLEPYCLYGNTCIRRQRSGLERTGCTGQCRSRLCPHVVAEEAARRRREEELRDLLRAAAGRTPT